MLASRAGVGADSVQIADALVAIWIEIDRDLSPILGLRGVVMLYHRCLHLSRPSYPWLSEQEDPRLPIDLGSSRTRLSARLPTDLGSLRSRLSARTPDQALEAGTDLLDHFYVVLTSLVGPSLTDNLLSSLWPPLSSGPAAQEVSS